MRKFLLIFLALVFTGFAYLNLNDPDPIPWVGAYGATAVLFAFAAFGRADRRIIAIFALALFIWMCTMLPGMIEWYRLGFPTITGAMHVTEPYIEVVREFLGLLIAVAALFGLYRSTPRTARMGGA